MAAQPDRITPAFTFFTIALLGVVAVLAMLAGVVCVVASVGVKSGATDIDAFIAAGRMILDGRGALIHDRAANLAALNEFANATRPVIWNYPPHGSLAAALIFGHVSPALARAIVSIATLLIAGGLAVQLIPRDADRATRLALALILLASAPMVLALVSGQPAYAIGMATFLAALYACKDQRAAILLVPIAVTKPHIGGPFLLAVFLLVPQARRTLFLGGLLTLALTGIAEAVIGWGATLRFLEAIRAASQTVAGNSHYMTDRLVTPMAEMSVLFSAEPRMARLMAALLSLCALGLILPALWRSRHDDWRVTLALASTLPLWVTPYLYDYDFGLQFAALIAALAVAQQRQAGVFRWLALAACLSILPPVVGIMNNVFGYSFKHSLGLLASMALTWAALQLPVTATASDRLPAPAS